MFQFGGLSPPVATGVRKMRGFKCTVQSGTRSVAAFRKIQKAESVA